ncbi:MAG: helix-turn-helix transcriptional regulator [Oscillibacter sp.]|nr:helix-turn-helix transcriptional regulator [Oscillibacter sp.]
MIDLKALWKKRGMTGVTLSQKAKISPSALSMIATGRRRPSVDLAKRLGAVLGVDWTLFFEDSGQNARPPPD